MCGIAGVLGRADPEATAAVERMVRALRHRGPDGTGVRATPDGRAVLGHTRLAIIDLTDAAAQPMASASGDRLVVFNGEIYNFQSLRERLRDRGQVFRTRSDTEVILQAYEAFGADRFVEELDGMFAFALWDAREARAVLARDRAGKKPLFVTAHAGATWFASELSALRAAGVPLEADTYTLPSYLVRGYVPAPGTLARGVEQVEPGTALELGPDGRRRRVRRYWAHPSTRPALGAGGHPRAGRARDARPAVTYEEDAGRAVTRVRERLVEAVRRRLVADVPVGAFLSGGVDSAAVVALATRITGAPVRTFTIGFRGPSSWDERAAARATARALGAVHVEHEAGPEDVTVLETLVARTGEPLADSSIIPTHLVAQLARREVTVALTGDGGDEVFAGYRRFLVVDVAGRIPRLVGEAIAAAMRRVPDPRTYGSLVGYARRFALLAGRSPGAALMELAGAFRPPDALRLCGRDAASSDAAVEALAAPETRALAAARAAGQSGLHGVLAANHATYLPGDLMTKADRATMAIGLEARAPFLDTALAETAAQMAPSLLVRRGGLKWLLRRVLADLVPREVLSRPKHGFGIPVGIWMRGPLRDWTEGWLTGASCRLGDLVDRAQVDALWREHLSGARDHHLRLWALVALECWLRWLAAPAMAKLPAASATSHAALAGSHDVAAASLPGTSGGFDAPAGAPRTSETTSPASVAGSPPPLSSSSSSGPERA